MGRNRQGWTLRRKVASGVWYVRFTIAGRTTERSTGTSDRAAAATEAARIYADAVARAPKPRRAVSRRGAAPPLEELVAAWLKWLQPTHAATTRGTWDDYATGHWLPFFEATHNVNSERCSAYVRKRIERVLAETVRKEASALRSFVGFLHEQGAVPELPLVPSVPKRLAGVPHTKRRRVKAPDLSPAQIAAVLALLPEWSESRKVARFPIRARFVVAYETGLRPSTLDRLSVPAHYAKGSTVLRLSADVDKGRWARDVPLSVLARAELDRICPDPTDEQPTPLIFGWHNYREHIRAAAKAALPKEIADRFAAAHLRSARITHLLEQPRANLPGVQHLVGHLNTATTARYVRPSFRAALEALNLGAPKKQPRLKARG